MILGIDQSLTSTGWAVLDHENGEIRDAGVIESAGNVLDMANKVLKGELCDIQKYILSKQKDLGDLVEYDEKKCKLVTKIPKSKMTKVQKKRLRMNIEGRLQHILDQLWDQVLLDFDIYWSFQENISFGSSGQVVTLGQLLGAIQGFLISQGVAVKGVAPTTLKSFAKARPKHKEDMEANMQDRDRVHLEGFKKKDDIVDAIWLARYGEIYVKEK